MLGTTSTSGRHVGLLVHVPRAASVVHDHGPLTIASAPRWRPDAVRAGDARRSSRAPQPLGLRPKSKRPFTQPMIADHKIVVVPSLLEVITSLQDIPAGDGYSAGPTIYAKLPWTPSTDAVVLRGDGVPDGLTTESGHHYLLEVDLAIEAIEVWSEWRAGVIPTPEEATLAVIYYGEHDAYQPLQ